MLAIDCVDLSREEVLAARASGGRTCATAADVHRKYLAVSQRHASNCTYCKKPGGFVTRGVRAAQVDVHEAYQLLNSGWRRFGEYLWCQADDICCKQTPIRVDVYEHQQRLTKDNKKVWKRLEKYLRKLGAENVPATLPSPPHAPPKKAGVCPPPRKCFSCGQGMQHIVAGIPEGYARPICDVCNGEFLDLVGDGYYHCGQCRIDVHRGCEFKSFVDHIVASIPEGLLWEYNGKKRLRVELVPPSFSDEKYALFLKYQRTVHGEDEGSGLAVLRIGDDDPALSDKERFIKYLVDSPLHHDTLRHPTSDVYGTFHIEYRLDGELFMTTVTDVLPNSLNSVYCFYDPEMRAISPGKFSILFEMAWMRKQLKYQHFAHYYLGMFFPHAKMLYKADFKPAELLDIATGVWRPFADADMAAAGDAVVKEGEGV